MAPVGSWPLEQLGLFLPPWLCGGRLGSLLDGEVPVLPACQLQPWLSSVLLALMGSLGPLLPTARVRQRGDIKALEQQIKGPGCIY